MFRGRLTYANVVATIALFLALGGGAYAALTLPSNSVGTKTVRDGSLRGRDVRDRSLTRRDLRAGTLRGLRGPRGLQGPPGGLKDLIVRENLAQLEQGGCQTETVLTADITTCTSPPQEVTASCLEGERAVGGGWQGQSLTANGGVTQRRSRTVADGGEDRPVVSGGLPTGWSVRAEGSSRDFGDAPPAPANFTVFVICSS